MISYHYEADGIADELAERIDFSLRRLYIKLLINQIRLRFTETRESFAIISMSERNLPINIGKSTTR